MRNGSPAVNLSGGVPALDFVGLTMLMVLLGGAGLFVVRKLSI